MIKYWAVLFGQLKKIERKCGKNYSNAICEVNTFKSALYGRRGIKKEQFT